MPLTAEKILIRVAQDEGPFVKLGTRFKCVKTNWMGPAVVSPQALYLVKRAKVQGHGGGLVGILLSHALSKDDGISTCTADDLPAAVRAIADPKGKLKAKEVVIVPRATVSFVKSNKWNNAVEMTAGGDKFMVATSLFSMWKRPRQLQEMGWTLNEALVPEAEAVHDSRPPELRVTKRQPLWKTVGLVALAVVIFVVVVALRVMAGN